MHEHSTHNELHCEGGTKYMLDSLHRLHRLRPPSMCQEIRIPSGLPALLDTVDHQLVRLVARLHEWAVGPDEAHPPVSNAFDEHLLDVLAALAQSRHQPLN